MKRALIFIIALLVATLACDSNPPAYTPSAPQATAGALNATYAAGTATAPSVTPSVTVTPEPTVTVTPSVTATPSATMKSSIIELPTLAPGTAIYEVPPETGGALSDADIRALANLCVVEVRGQGAKRDAACVSVVSTVLTRVRSQDMSDGTVIGTIRWRCYRDTVACQFPAYVTRGCEGISPQSCPDNYPDDQVHFVIVVYEYTRLLAITRGACLDYLYYGSRPSDRGDCEIAGPNGVEGFHK
jgi:hypothetical protein